MIRTSGLTKRYGDEYALHDVSLEVPTGSVYGLVGPNGAGKTTLLSIVAGLRKATSGTFEIDAAHGQRSVLPDAPRFDGWLTAREVVSLAAHLIGTDNADIDGRLAETGLLESADRPVSGFSRGMLQRLGIAATLIGDPKLVILDEPAAALDPAGRREVLDIVEGLRGRTTVVFSSHILSDVQTVCDTVGIISDGTLRFEGSVTDLLTGAARTSYLVRFSEAPDENTAAALTRHDWVTTTTAVGERTLRIGVATLGDAERHLIPALASLGSPIVMVEPEPVTLESIFLEMTS